MARIDFTIPALGEKFVDIRDTLPGDSFNWSWIRSLDQVKFLAIHHSGSPDTQTPNDIADFHINVNGWGGIGYHFLISKDGTTYYVGDIGTARANVANLNEQVIGICLIGNFVDGNLPSQEQLDSGRILCNFLINFAPLSNLNYWEAVRGHKELPGQSTTCPGDSWDYWKRGLLALKKRIELKEDKDKDNDKDVLKTQIDSLQTTLASLNQQVIFLQEALLQKDAQINALANTKEPSLSKPETHEDTTLTIIGAAVALYNFVFQPRKEAFA